MKTVSGYERWPAVILCALLVIIVMLPNFIIYRVEPGRDSGACLYAGWRILNGDVPYRDLWDREPPLTQFVDAAGLLAGGGSIWGVQALEFAAILCAALIGRFLTRRVFGETPALAALVVWVVSLVMVLEGGNLPGEYGLPLQFLILYLFWKSEDRRVYSWRGFFIGVAGGALFLMRPNLAGLAAAVGFFLAGRLIAGPRRRSAVTALLAMAAGFALPLCLLFAYLGAHGASGDFIDQVFRYNLACPPAAVAARGKALLHGLRLLSFSGLTLLALAGWVVGIVYQWRDRWGSGGRSSLVKLLLIALPMVLALTSFSGKTYAHYYMAWLPCFAMLTALFVFSFGYEGEWERFAAGEADENSCALRKAALVGLLAAVCVLPAATLSRRLIDAGDLVESSGRGEVASLVEKMTDGDDFVLVWGAEPSVNFLARRRSPSLFYYQSPLFNRACVDDGMVGRLRSDLDKRMPAIIIDTSPSNDLVPPVGPAPGMDWVPPSKLYGLSPGMEELRDFFAAKFRRKGIIGSHRWPVYVRK